jgi:hypothetical protein
MKAEHAIKTVWCYECDQEMEWIASDAPENGDFKCPGCLRTVGIEVN